jgi:hypothetical protein
MLNKKHLRIRMLRCFYDGIFSWVEANVLILWNISSLVAPEVVVPSLQLSIVPLQQVVNFSYHTESLRYFGIYEE